MTSTVLIKTDDLASSANQDQQPEEHPTVMTEVASRSVADQADVQADATEDDSSAHEVDANPPLETIPSIIDQSEEKAPQSNLGAQSDEPAPEGSTLSNHQRIPEMEEKQSDLGAADSPLPTDDPLEKKQPAKGGSVLQSIKTATAWGAVYAAQGWYWLRRDDDGPRRLSENLNTTTAEEILRRHHQTRRTKTHAATLERLTRKAY